MRFRFLLLFALLSAMAALLVVACGGDDDDASDSDDRRSASRDEDEDEDSGDDSDQQDDEAPTKGSGSAQPTATSGGVTGSGANALKKLAQDLSGKTYQVTYDFTSVVEGKTSKGVMTIAQKPPKNATKFEFPEGTSLVISDATSSVFCTMAGSQGTCFRSSTAPDAPGAFDLEDTLDNLETEVNVTEVSGQTIAGRKAKCFQVKQSEGDGITCFDEKDGLLLLIESKEGQAFTMRAKEVKTSVDAELLEPPYPVTELQRN